MQWNNHGYGRFPVGRWSLMGLLAGWLAVTVAAGEPQAPSPAPAVELGMWVWQAESIDDPAERAALLAFCKQNGISRLLVQVHFADAGDGLADPQQVKDFLAAASDASISVEALNGSSGDGLDIERDETLRRLATVLAFQKSLPNGRGFIGIHYDIEPYLTSRWKQGEMREVALETLATMTAIEHDVRAAAPTLTIAYDIPYWYDRKEELMLDYGGHRQNFQEHIQDLSDYVGVMSYRRTATGPKSVTELSETILGYAAKHGKKAYVSLETALLKNDQQISFNGGSPDLLLQVIDQLRTGLGGTPGFGGILLHDYKHLRVLLDSKAKSAGGDTTAHP